MVIKRINNIWLKASILGCLWASSEIVLGSFLHNLRIPFSGNILTAIGIILMVSIGQVWTDRGLFWRAGLICALMKSISPSAIIFGPMIAIYTESLIMEASTFMFRKSALSFLIGGALAMSWNLIQMLVGYVIIYGSNVIHLYQKLSDYFHHQLGMASGNNWWPIIIIAIFYLLAGLIASGIGLYVGRRTLKTKLSEKETFENNLIQNIPGINKKPEGKFSLILLACNIMLIVAALTVFNFNNILLSSIVVLLVAAFWILKYPKVLRPLKRPGFWIFLLVTTILSVLLFNSFAISKYEGWIIGAEMNLRAVIMILGFAVIGRELRNPEISKWFSRAGFNQLPVALELAFESLPAVIAHMPGWKEITHKPISSFNNYIHIAELQLKEQEIRRHNHQKIIIITGEQSEGKTSFLEKIIPMLKQSGLGIYGFIAKAYFENGIKCGYMLHDIYSGSKTNIIQTEDFPGAIKFRRFFFNTEGIDKGRAILDSEIDFDADNILIIDEIGPLELDGGGWAESINKLTTLSQYNMIWIVRKKLVEVVIKKWNLTDPIVIDISKKSVESANELIKETFS